jgi:hypothetical protein
MGKPVPMAWRCSVFIFASCVIERMTIDGRSFPQLE